MPKSLLIFLLFTSGCSLRGSDAEAPIAPEAPVEVRVDRAFYQSDGLHVKVRVTSKTDLPTSDIVVNVTGLDEGQVIESYEQRLSEVFPVDELDVGEAALLDFLLKNPELSEYQVQCRWGEEAHKPTTPEIAGMPREVAPDDARAALALSSTAEGSAPAAALAADPPMTGPPITGPAITEPAKPESIKTEQAPIEPATLERGIELPLLPSGGDLVLKLAELEQRAVNCEQPPCDRYFTIRATLLNQSAAPIGGIVLASGLQWVNDGATVSPPEPFSKVLEGESAVALEGFVLQPGKEKRLKVAVDRAVPTVPGGQFVPYLRMVASGAVAESPPQAARE